MSIKIMSRVFEDSESEGTDRLVMLALADFCDDDGTCFPGVSRIARKCRISERTVQRAFQSLVEIGELRIDEKKGARTNGGATNRFTLILTRKEGGDKMTGGDNQGIKVVTIRGKGGDTAMSPESSAEPSGEPSVVELLSLSLEAETRKLTQEELITQHLSEKYTEDETFMEAIADYIDIRKRKKAPITEGIGKRLARDFEAWGLWAATTALEASIRANWTDVYPPKNGQCQNPSGIAPTPKKKPVEQTWTSRHITSAPTE